MADIIKQGARKPLPRIKEGFAFTGCDYKTDEPRGPDGMPPMVYTLAVSGPFVNGRVEVGYRVELSEDEMLGTISGWMEKLTRNRAEEKRRLTKLKERGQTP